MTLVLVDDTLADFHAPVREWFSSQFPRPTPAQSKGWPPIRAGRSTLLLAPTGSGKTLAAFLAGVDRLMFSAEPPRRQRCRLLYVSPLKALAVDVERNLQAPIAGIAAAAARLSVDFRVPTVAIRSGDTPQSERARISRTPPDILITTPESLYLLLTSEARAVLASVDTVIVDEIHSVVATKRGAHLFLSLERLERLRASPLPLQRIGLSATQRPLGKVASLLGGGIVRGGEGEWTPREVEIVDAGSRKAFELLVEVPVEDMARIGEGLETASSARPGSTGERRSIWPSMHPRLVELVRAHRATMIFVNSRRLAERLASALNETAGEEIAAAHHGSIAREKRQEIEERLKRGDLPAIVATSSLELGIDMGAVDLVIQIEAPPSVASGVQRIGRAGHSVGEVSRGIIFPKFRGDLLACAAATVRMAEGKVEETFFPRNPLDVLAQQIVAIASLEEISVPELYDMVRAAAPFADLPLSSFEGVLDMLSGRYPSDEFAELRPRLTWDRLRGRLKAREGARRVAVVNAGTIPDRGLYGVFLARVDGAVAGAGAGDGDSRRSRRVGELDEEMVFESRAGDVFLLGASSWRIEEITHDRVLVSPALGQPGKMPFWKGDRAGRPTEFGRAIGELTRELASMPAEPAERLLRERHGLDARAAANLLAYLSDQKAASGEVPSDRTVVIERNLDEVGDWRICVLSPFGARVHAPWAIAVTARLQERTGGAVEMLWSDDGMVFRLPESDAPPEVSIFFPSPEEIEDLVVATLPETSLFAARFRENAARALLLPRRRPGQRSPLWHQRKRAADLLAVASRYGSFPILLETYRECLRDVFDVPGLVEILSSVAARRISVVTVESRKPSPFAASLLFSYVANFIYDGDAPLAERRAQALSVDPVQLRELLGEAELRELLDAEAIDAAEKALQHLDGARPARHEDAVHDLLIAIGDLTEPEIRLRCDPPDRAESWLADLSAARRVIPVTICGQERFAAAEDAARLRDALGVVLPFELAPALLAPVADPLGDLVSRFARTHSPFHAESVASRWGLPPPAIDSALARLAAQGRVVEGEFLPGGRKREWCDAEVLRMLKRRSLAKLRREVEPVDAATYARFLSEWQGVARPRTGQDALLSAIDQLQGCPLAASALETEILPARVQNYDPADLDLLCAAGEVVWRGLESVGDDDGRIALYPADRCRLLAPPPAAVAGPIGARIRDLLMRRGALFFSDIAAETGAFASDLTAALWDLVWAGEVTNDTLAPMRSVLRSREAPARRAMRGRGLRLRRGGPPGSEGRWSLLARTENGRGAVTSTERASALANALLQRYGVVTREGIAAEGSPGGFSAVYEVLRAMEDAGRVRRGYFVAGLGAAQFALPGADDRLRSLRQEREKPEAIVLSATDPANPYGAAIGWPEKEGARPERRAGAQVILLNGRLLASVRRSENNLITFLPEDEPERGAAATAVARALARPVESGRRRAVLVGKIDGAPARESPLAPFLEQAGFRAGSRGYLKRLETRVFPRQDGVTARP